MDAKNGIFSYTTKGTFGHIAHPHWQVFMCMPRLSTFMLGYKIKTLSTSWRLSFRIVRTSLLCFNHAKPTISLVMPLIIIINHSSSIHFTIIKPCFLSCRYITCKGAASNLEKEKEGYELSKWKEVFGIECSFDFFLIFIHRLGLAFVSFSGSFCGFLL